MAKRLTLNFVSSAKKRTHWHFANQILYDLCRDYPKHTNEQVVIGKVWLIGRSYSVAIERVHKKVFVYDDIYKERVGRMIVESKVDKWLLPLNRLRYGPGSLAEVLLAHKRLTEVFHDISGAGKRSLASKYLHFHFPNLFYIYDSRVVKALRNLRPVLETEKGIDLDCDSEYRRVYEKCAQLRRKINHRLGVNLCPRELDNLLLEVSEWDTEFGW